MNKLINKTSHVINTKNYEKFNKENVNFSRVFLSKLTNKSYFLFVHLVCVVCVCEVFLLFTRSNIHILKIIQVASEMNMHYNLVYYVRITI